MISHPPFTNEKLIPEILVTCPTYTATKWYNQSSNPAIQFPQPKLDCPRLSQLRLQPKSK